MDTGNNLPMCDVTIIIVSASGLKRVDFFKSPDPYVCMTIGGKTYNTPTVRKTTDPYWGQNFDVQVTKDSIVEFEVMDERTRTKSLGKTRIRIGSYANFQLYKAQSAALPLKPSNHCTLSVEFRPF